MRLEEKEKEVAFGGHPDWVFVVIMTYSELQLDLKIYHYIRDTCYLSAFLVIWKSLKDTSHEL